MDSNIVCVYTTFNTIQYIQFVYYKVHEHTPNGYIRGLV